MAEQDIPQTAGTVLEKYFGSGAYARTFGDATKQVFGATPTGVGEAGWAGAAGIGTQNIAGITPQQIAALTRGDISAAERNTLQTYLLGTQGTLGYMSLFPEMYSLRSGMGGGMSPEEMEIASLSAMSRQMSGIGGIYARWLISNRIKELEYAIAKDLISRGARQEVSPLRLREAPIPDWMRPYIEEGVPYTQASASTERSGRRRQESEITIPTGAGKLRPLSAQENLNPEQMQMMAAYQAWGQMGFPTSFGANADRQALIRGLLDTETFWQPYTRASQKLFPTARNRVSTWTIAAQR